MAWIYQLVDTIPVPLARPNLKVGAVTIATATQVHLSLVVKRDVAVIVTALVLAARAVTMELVVLVPHIMVFCGQPTMASSDLLLTALPMICWELSVTAPAPVSFL